LLGHCSIATSGRYLHSLRKDELATMIAPPAWAGAI